MKPVTLLLLLSALLLAACQPGSVQKASTVCLESCDDVLRQLARTSSIMDEATLVARSAGSLDETSQLFRNSGDELSKLASLVGDDVASQGKNSFQLTEDILRSSSQYSDDLARLQNWASQYQDGADFFGTLVCDYRDYYMSAWQNSSPPNEAQFVIQFLSSYSNAPPDGVSVLEAWVSLGEALQQEKINIWDSSITLYCAINSTFDAISD
jgi:hypothetical protein